MNVVIVKAFSHSLFNKICFFYNAVHCSLFEISPVAFAEPTILSSAFPFSFSGVVSSPSLCCITYTLVFPRSFILHSSQLASGLPLSGLLPSHGFCSCLYANDSQISISSTDHSLSTCVSLANIEHMYPSAC